MKAKSFQDLLPLRRALAEAAAREARAQRERLQAARLSLIHI